MSEREQIICPFCEEGTLVTVACRKCARRYLRCDECGSVFKGRDSLEEEYGSECPHCGEALEHE